MLFYSEPAWVFMVVNDPIISIEDQTGDGNTHQQMVGKEGKGNWTQLYGLKLPDTLTGTLYAYKTKVDAKTEKQKVESFKNFKLQDGLTNEQIAKYTNTSINATGIAIQSDGFDTPQAAWEAVFGKRVDTEWKSLTADTYKYYPVFPDNAVPSGVEFATKNDDESFTTIENPTMTKLADSAYNGTLHYRGGAIQTVRSIGPVSYNSVWDTDGATYTTPYHATKLQETFKASLKDGETVCTLDTDPQWTTTSPYYPQKEGKDVSPNINGVPLQTIQMSYNPVDEETAELKYADGLGAPYGDFWSCVAYSSRLAYYWGCYYGGYWHYYYRDYGNFGSVLVSRAFS